MNLLMPQARFDEALTELELALEVDPLSAFFRMLHSVLLVLDHRFDEAIADAQMVVDLEPDSYWGYLVLGSSYRELGKYEKAIETHRKALAASGNTPSMMGWLGMSLAFAGQKEEARSLLATLHSMAQTRYVPATSFAWIHHGLGEREAEFEWIDRAIEERDQLIMPIKSYAFFDCLRSDPRFQALVRKMRLDP
jgi:Flp pilus assembly protein TadD